VVVNPHKFRKLAGEKWFHEALERARRPDMICFAWKVEFPEVFFAGLERHPNPGFDAINPPYDVLSELERERDLSAFRAVIKDSPVLKASAGGKNNLYKLFVCQALDYVSTAALLPLSPVVLGGERPGVRGSTPRRAPHSQPSPPSTGERGEEHGSGPCTTF
jgi:hypothetical protein